LNNQHQFINQQEYRDTVKLIAALGVMKEWRLTAGSLDLKEFSHIFTDYRILPDLWSYFIRLKHIN
jgi:hypothetical protein